MNNADACRYAHAFTAPALLRLAGLSATSPAAPPRNVVASGAYPPAAPPPRR